MDTVSGNKKVMDKWTDIISESSLFKGVEKNETEIGRASCRERV